MKISLTAVALCSLLLVISRPARAADDNAWQLKVREKGATVFSRPRGGSDILELKATGTIDAPPPAVFKVLSGQLLT
ncbi:MAG: hypothetical protein NTV46_02520 [Verrucomicrobia bacterium]|nr:hypothetical protein [Verrucomicrobiota bacterium]